MQRKANEKIQDGNWLVQARSDAELPRKTDQPTTSTDALILDEPASCCSAEESQNVPVEKPCCSEAEIVDEVLETIDERTEQETETQASSAVTWPHFAAASFVTFGVLTLHAKKTQTRRRHTRDLPELDDVSVD
jgi:hypothetical protein